MSFQKIYFHREYRSDDENTILLFFQNALRDAVKYNRAVGYFTISALLNLSHGLIPLIEKKGEINIICSPLLSEKDYMLLKGVKYSEEIVFESLMKQIRGISVFEEKVQLNLIVQLIKLNILKIKIAYKSDGIYHEKLGVIYDSEGNYISFEGSNNETYSAQMRNYESFRVFPSWNGASEYANDTVTHFNKLWDNNIKELDIMDIPEAIKNEIIVTYNETDNLEEAITLYKKTFISKKNIVKKNDIVDERNLFEYQERAIKLFKNHNYRYFFEMATGTGKTYTSVKAIIEMKNSFDKLFIVILVPQIDLQHQWYQEIKKSDLSPVFTLGGNMYNLEDWETTFNKSLISYQLMNQTIIYISTYDSFFSKLVNKLSNISNLMIIVDEAHNLSKNQIGKLPKQAKFRLGLSATPEKHNIDETKEIIQYFSADATTFKYTIEEAINNGFLSEYIYEPIFVRLSDDDFKKYNNYSQKIAATRSSDNVDKEQIINKLLNERSLIIKKCSSKLLKLADLLSNSDYEFKNSVIYCGQGKDEASDEKIIDRVSSILYERTKYKISTFTSQTENRFEVLKQFELNNLDVLVAIKCFDEGVDIPKLDKIYIMSSDRLHRQTIQRRGRVLRKSKESGKDLAFIYDFVVLPPENEIDLGKNLVKNEFYRVKEYARLSKNKNEIFNIINEIEKKFNIKEENYFGE